MLLTYQLSAQNVVQDLFAQGKIPFKLNAEKVMDEGDLNYRIYFYDSRIHSVLVNAGKVESVYDQIRAALLRRANEIEREVRYFVARSCHPGTTPGMK